MRSVRLALILAGLTATGAALATPAVAWQTRLAGGDVADSDGDAVVAVTGMRQAPVQPWSAMRVIVTSSQTLFDATTPEGQAPTRQTTVADSVEGKVTLSCPRRGIPADRPQRGWVSAVNFGRDGTVRLRRPRGLPPRYPCSLLVAGSAASLARDYTRSPWSPDSVRLSIVIQTIP
jgi:hypothetical protein